MPELILDTLLRYSLLKYSLVSEIMLAIDNFSLNNWFERAWELKISPVVKIGLVSSGANLNSWGECASLAMVGHTSSDGITIKMPYGLDILNQPALHPLFSYWDG